MSKGEVWTIIGMTAFATAFLTANYYADRTFSERWREQHKEFQRECREAGGHPVRSECVFPATPATPQKRV